MAQLSRDERLLQAFRDGQDIHRATAAEVFDVALDEVSADQRRAAKAINFGLMYGMSDWGLARQLEMNQAEAQSWIERYFERYNELPAILDDIRNTTRCHGSYNILFAI